MKLKIRTGGLTDVGRKRDHNEDKILVADEMGLYAVADGMGGHAAGEIASETAIRAIEKFVHRALNEEDITWPFGAKQGLTREENILNTAVALANNEICAQAESESSMGGMGTTVVAVFVPAETAYIVHVGDSRVYLFRAEKLIPLTSDHSWVNEQVQRKIISEDEARTHRWRNVITRALGNQSEIQADMTRITPEKGDMFLLCSDGLTTMIEDFEIAECLAASNGNLDTTCHELVRRANEAGGTDNVSVVIVRIDGFDENSESDDSDAGITQVPEPSHSECAPEPNPDDAETKPPFGINHEA